MKAQMIGLMADEVLVSREKHGSNALERKKTKGFFLRFFENLSDPIIRILLIATFLRILLSFGGCNWFEIGGILLAVFIAAFVTTVSEWGSERAFERMACESKSKTVRAVRDGVPVLIYPDEIVVGDILYLSAGETVQADGILIEGCVCVNQSALNGEAAEMQKSPAGKVAPKEWRLEDKACVFRGSTVTEGKGVALVCRVGQNTFYGGVASGVQEQTRESPLKARLSVLAKQISRIGYIMAAIVALSNLFFTLVVDNGFSVEKIIASITDFPGLFSKLLHAFSLMITVIVVAVPEGLPMMITVVLSSNMKRMQRDGVAVKKMVGIETAGSLNILFTDKTGTLTTGNLSVDSLFTEKERYASILQLKRNPTLYNYLCLCASYNTDICGGLGGNQTDKAIHSFFKNEAKPKAHLISSVPFDSVKKYATAEIVYEGRQITLIKGAPEIVIGMCESSDRSNGGDTVTNRENMLNLYRKEAAEGKRILAFGFKEKQDTAFKLLCFASLRDKLRQGVKQAVKEVQDGGVQVVMITGDGRETASAIARECGVLVRADKDCVIEAEAFRAMKDEEAMAAIPSLRVICRALPSDKMRLVELSQRLGLVVGMTGDGINDATALKKADVGFAMGSGTEIAKSCADIVLTNDHFSAIGKTVLYGRTIFHSIRKFITFQLIMNLAACGVSFLGQFLGIDHPITIVQMLWVNMIMDTLGGLAFAGEPPLAHYMKEKPKSRTEPILTGQMIKKILITGSFTLAVCILYLGGRLLRGRFDPSPTDPHFLTGFFALFIFIGLFNSIQTRSDRFRIFHGIFGNRPFLMIISLIACIQLWIIYRGGALFRTVPLSIEQLLSVLSLSFLVIPFEFFRRTFEKLGKN